MEKAPYGVITDEMWAVKREAAIALLETRKDIKRVLLEVSSQHPLKNGTEPGIEFAGRLDRGIELFHSYQSQGYEVEFVVTGSRHKEGEIVDQISLSESGVNYLLAKRIDPFFIHGQDLIERYKGPASVWPGVYNSADEVYVAAMYFKDGNFGKLVSTVGSAQLHRKALSYIWNGVVPLMYSVPADTTYHDYVREAQEIIPNVLGADPDMQHPNSFYADLSRKLRKVD